MFLHLGNINVCITPESCNNGIHLHSRLYNNRSNDKSAFCSCLTYRKLKAWVTEIAIAPQVIRKIFRTIFSINKHERKFEWPQD